MAISVLSIFVFQLYKMHKQREDLIDRYIPERLYSDAYIGGGVRTFHLAQVK